MEILNLSQVLSLDAFEQLDAAERTEYLAAFAAFKQAHTAAYPNGQLINVAIASTNILPDQKGFLRLEAKPSPVAYTPVFKYKPATLNILFKNALQVTAGVALSILGRCLSKGALRMTVRLVDETDVYVKTTDGIEEEINFKGPGVARFEGTDVEYVPSPEVLEEVKGVFKAIEVSETAKMIAEMNGTAKPAVVAVKEAVPVDEDEI